MANIPTFEELKRRIAEDSVFSAGQVSERSALAWYGYLAALIEWKLISIADHEKLCRMLPSIDENPAVAILIGKSEPTKE